MKVILAKKAGFCMGVRRAVETTLETVRKEEKTIATFGPLIHNPQVLDVLSDKGVQSLQTVPKQHNGTIIIRAHGVPPDTKNSLRSTGAAVRDATCPRVVKVQVIIQKYREKGYATVIIGDRNHAEVEGLMGYAGPNGFIVSNDGDVEKLNITSKFIVVSQTTQDEAIFKNLSDSILKKFPQGEIFNTICDSTHKRQEEVRRLCQKVDALVVVGGKNSANTQRLGEIAESMSCPVFMAETEVDLDFNSLKKFDLIGVTAGASTPTWMINRVVRAIESTPGMHEGLFNVLLFKFIWLMLATNLLVSLGGGLLTYAGSILQGIAPNWDYFFISFGHLFAMHNLNRFVEHSAKKFNDPLRERFSAKYRLPLLAIAILFLVLSLLLAYHHGKTVFVLLLCMSTLGILYRVRLIPPSISSFIKIRRLKEIPGSKTLLIALAWAFVAVLVPALSNHVGHGVFQPAPTISAFVFVFLLVFVRNALFDVFDVQGDQIVGRETLPVFIGEKKTIKLLYTVLLIEVMFLFIMPILNLMPTSGFFMIPPVLYLMSVTYLYERKYFSQGPKLEFAVDSIFILIAFLALISNL